MRERRWIDKSAYTYGLKGTPTTFTLEARLATLEGAEHLMLVPSGLAAIMLIDLAGVTWVDSSAVSMLLEWMRTAQTYDRRIEFINLPSNLADLIELYDVGSLIPTDKPAESV